MCAYFSRRIEGEIRRLNAYKYFEDEKKPALQHFLFLFPLSHSFLRYIFVMASPYIEAERKHISQFAFRLVIFFPHKKLY